MNKPTNLKELIAYLADNPYVINGNGPVRTLLRFTGHRQGGLWFVKTKTKEDVYLPINCGLVDSETGLNFFDDRFEITKFGISFTYYYAIREMLYE